jgi:hypothetical protein
MHGRSQIRAYLARSTAWDQTSQTPSGVDGQSWEVRCTQVITLGAWERVEYLTCGVNKDVIEDWENSSVRCV